MSELIAFLADHWISVGAGAIGVVGSIASIVSYSSARRTKREYEYVFRLAALHADKDLTEKQIEERRGEASRLSQHVVDLQDQIRRDIPREARRAVLRDRLEAAKLSLTTTHGEVITLHRQLLDLGEPATLPPEVMRAVEAEVEPRYLEEQRHAQLRNILTVLSASAAAGSTLLPYPVGRTVGAIFILGSVPFIGLMLRDLARRIARHDRRDFIVSWAVIAGGIVCGGVAAFAGWLSTEARGDAVLIFLFVALLGSVASVGLCGYGLLRLRRLRQQLRRNPANKGMQPTAAGAPAAEADAQR